MTLSDTFLESVVFVSFKVLILSRLRQEHEHMKRKHIKTSGNYMCVSEPTSGFMEAQCDVSIEAQTEVVVEDVNRKLRKNVNDQTVK